VKIKLDENLPERLVSELRALGHDIDTVRSEHLAGRDDDEIWQATQAGNRFLITQDLDFPTCAGSSLGHTRDCCWCGSHGLAGAP